MTSIAISRDLAESLVDSEPCDFDHHGGCQAHGYLSLDPGEMCPQAELKKVLAENDAPTEIAQPKQDVETDDELTRRAREAIRAGGGEPISDADLITVPELDYGPGEGLCDMCERVVPKHALTSRAGFLALCPDCDTGRPT